MDARPSLTSTPRAALQVVSAGTFLTAFSGSAVALALPHIGPELGLSLHLSSWILQGYLLVVTALLLVAGPVGDRLGHRRVYLSGLLLFGAASGTCGLAPSLELLVFFRLTQGLGGAAIMATGPALLTTAFSPDQRGRALGMQAAATYSGLTLGPPLGGFVIGELGWRWIFLLNVPVALVVTALGRNRLQPSPHAPRAAIDGRGAATLLVGLPLLLLALTQGESWGWLSWPTLGSASGGAVVLTAFVAIELRQRTPLLDLRLFRARIFTSAVISAVCNYVALFVPVLLLPFYLTEGRGMNPSQVGLLLALQPLAMALVVAPSGALSDRFGTRTLAAGGMAVMTLALLGLSTLDGESSWLEVGLGLALLGLGTGTFISPNSSALMGAAPRHKQGVAAGVMAVARTFGMLLGIALGTTVYHAAGGETGGVWSAGDYVALRLALVTAAAVSLGGAVAILAVRAGLPERRPR